MVVPLGSHNVIPVLDRHHARRLNNTKIDGVGVSETRTEGEYDRKTRGGLSRNANSIWTTTEKILQTSSRTSLQAGTTTLVPASSPLSLDSARKSPTRSPQSSLHRIESSHAIQQSSPVQKTNLPLSVSAPAVVVIAVPDRTSSRLQRTPIPTVALSQPVSRSVAPPVVTPLVKSGRVPSASSVKPLPGKNQSQPILDAIVVASLVQLTAVQSSLAPTTTKSTLDLQASPTSTALPPAAQPPSLAPLTMSSGSRLALFPTPTSFITLTRTQRAQEQASDPPNASSTSEAISVTRSLSTLLSSTILATSVAVVPTAPQITLAAASDPQQRRSRLTPLARNLFISLGALGAVAILIALGVVLIMRSRRKKNPELTRKELSTIAAVENAIGPFYSPPSPSVYSVKTHKAPNEPIIDNPFLTESEKAIVMRAAPGSGEPTSNDTTAKSSIKDAVEAFIAKSRRLTYKISP